MQLWATEEPMMAVSTVMMNWIMVLMVSFFIVSHRINCCFYVNNLGHTEITENTEIFICYDSQ